MSTPAPVFTALVYDGQQLSAQWSATPPPNGFGGYQLTLTENNQPGELFTVQTAQFALQRVLNASSTYTLQVAMLVNGQPGDPSTVLTVITQAPCLIQIVNSGSTVSYRWTAAGGAGVGGYFAMLDTPTTNYNNNTDASELTTVFTQALAGVGGCTASVRATDTTGIVLGPPAAVRAIVTEAPALTRVDNSGTQVALSWTAAGGGGVEGYFAILSTPATNYTATTDALELGTRFAQTLAGQGPCTAVVMAGSADGVVVGPPSDMPTLILDAPTFVEINNSGSGVAYRWTAVSDSTVGGYLAGLDTVASNYTESAAVGTTQVSFAQVLAGAGNCTAWVRARSADSVVLGPPTPIRTVVTEAPLLSLIDNDGAQVAYSWQAAGGQGVESYMAGLVTPPTNYNQSCDASQLTLSFSVPLAGLGSCQFWVRAASSDGVVLGPPTPSPNLITEAPTLGSLAYDSGALGLVWTPTGEAAVSDYLAVVTPAGAAGTEYSLGLSGNNSAGVSLTSGGSYQVTVRGSAPQLKGPPGNMLQPLTVAPQAGTLTAQVQSGFSLSWVAAADPRVNGYAAEFFANGVSQATVDQAASPAPFAGTLTSGVLYQGRVRATAPQVAGPWSASINGPCLSSMMPSFDGLGRLTGARWDQRAVLAMQLDAFGNVKTTSWSAVPAPP